MKKLSLIFGIALLLIVGLQKSYGTHVAGAVITYEYIGANQYRVFLTAYRDCSGATLTSQTETINFRNQCGNNGNFQVTRLPGTGEEIPTACETSPTTCANPPGFRFGIQLIRYSGLFTVPAGQPDNCQGWTFSWNLCCRNSSSTLVGQPNMFVESFVNHAAWVLPKNNSPSYNVIEIPAYCFNEDIEIEPRFNESQGDSISFSFVSALQGANTNAPYQTTPVLYSFNNPSAAPTPPTIDPKTGKIIIVGNTRVQDVVVVIRAYELRQRSPGVWDTIGWTTLDIMVVIGPGRYCDNVVPTYSSRNLIRPCEDTSFIITFNKDLTCNTISTDGSELRLFETATNTTIPIKRVEAVACRTSPSGLVTNRIQVFLDQMLYKNGNYIIVSRIGTDGDTYGNPCDRFMDTFDTLNISISNCYEYNDPMTLTNVTVDSVTNDAFIINWEEPENFDFFYFKHYRLFRTLDPINDPYRHFTLITNSQTFNFRDDMPEDLPSNRPSRYAIDLELKSSLKNQKSNIIKSVTLKENEPISSPDDETLTVSWNSYNGWNNPSYIVELGRGEETKTWTYLATTSDTSIEIKKPLDPGKFYIRTYTKQPTTNLISFSNWISFEVPERFISIPNVFTPNGDGVNDNFEIDNIRFYPGSKIVVYDRWGRKVFQSDNYQNEWGGNDVKAGTYYYVFTQSTGEVYNGNIRVITN